MHAYIEWHLENLRALMRNLNPLNVLFFDVFSIFYGMKLNIIAISLNII